MDKKGSELARTWGRVMFVAHHKSCLGILQAVIWQFSIKTKPWIMCNFLVESLIVASRQCRLLEWKLGGWADLQFPLYCQMVFACRGHLWLRSFDIPSRPFSVLATSSDVLVKMLITYSSSFFTKPKDHRYYSSLWRINI